MCAAMNPALQWDQVYPPLWLQVMSPAKLNVGNLSHCAISSIPLVLLPLPMTPQVRVCQWLVCQ